jgi:endonuclease G
MPRSTHSAIRLRPIALLTAVAVICLGLSIRVLVRRSAALTNDGSIMALGVALTENFDTLPSSGSATWTNNSTIPGWHHARTGTGAMIVANDGGNGAGNLYSYGTGTTTDRALGSVGSGNAEAGNFFWGVRLQNNTGSTITSLDISYTGEQWRNGGATAQTAFFSYLVGSPTVTGSLVEFQSAGVAVPSLDFTSLVTGGTAGALNGNLAANRVSLSFTITGLNIPNGTEVMLRWSDPDHASTDHGLAIDDLSVTAFGDGGPTPTPTPTPGPTPTPTPTPTPVDPGIVVISQVYGGGGNTGATLRNDFIEIINHSTSAVDLSGWSVQYASADDQNWTVTPLTSFILQPGQYYLIKEAAGMGGTVDLPAPDAIGEIGIGSGSGKIALVNNTVPLTGLCPSDPAVVDFVGYGTANCSEGPGAAPTLTNTTAALRGLNGCLDTNNNAADFVAGSPIPRNSSSPTNNCAILSGIGSANPNSVDPADTTTLTVRVFPAPNPPSTGISVVADLSSIGGSPNQSFIGSGNIFTFNATVAPGTMGGMKSLPVTITDEQGRSFSAGISLNVRSPHVVISQVYGGGGNSGATYTNDFVELYNPTAATVPLTGWSLQYASATGTSWTNRQPIGGFIEPGQYFLIRLASGGGGAPLPVTPNISGDINMAAGSGKIALVRNSAPLSGACPIGNQNIVDFVGYGTSANCREGSENAPQLNNTTAIFRINNGQTDTDRNNADFVAATPNPRRTAAIAELGPWVASTDPLTDGTNVPYDATITVDFGEPVDVIGAWYGITCSATGLHNSATVASYNGSRGYHITANVSFQLGETCVVTIFKNQVHDQDLDDSAPDTDTLPGDYAWSFTVVGASSPAPYPPGVHLTMGNPSNATPSLSEPNNYLMEKPAYTLSYNRDRGIANWVSWHLDQSWFGTLARADTFRADPKVPADWYRVQSTDYSGSGFDRGHSTPNADRDNDTRTPINQETFLMTNMIPQAPAMNQGPWAAMENDLRTIASAGNELYIVMGGHGVGGTGNNGLAETIANGHVTVPNVVWRVILTLPAGVDDVSRVSCGTRTIAVIMPNSNTFNGSTIGDDNWQNFIVSVDQVESLTGYDFFSNLPDAVENCIEAGVNGANPPGTANQSAAALEDTPVTIALHAARSNNNALTFSIVGGGPNFGSLSSIGATSCVDGDCFATATYTPGPDYNGADSFDFKVSDGSIDSNVSTVAVNVTAANDPPVAANDAKSTTQDRPLNFPASDLTANDITGPANETGQTLTVTGVNATADTHGTVALSDGIVIYSPAANYSGLASFEYQVCDNGATNGAPDSRCAVASVNVTVALTSLVGLDGVTISGAAYADGYDSSGGYPATKGSLANILSNGAITIANSGAVWGNVRSTRAGVTISGASKVTGNAAAGTAVSRYGSATVGGTITNNAPSPLLTLPAVPACGHSYSSNSGISGAYSYNASTGDLTLSGINIATLANGVYCFRNLTLTNSAQLKINGPVVIKLTGTLNIGGASRLNNTTGIPGNLQILSSYSGTNGVRINNGADTHMMVYAPQTGVNISGMAPLFGGVVGKTISVVNSGAIHHDTGLKTIWPDVMPATQDR